MVDSAGREGREGPVAQRLPDDPGLLPAPRRDEDAFGGNHDPAVPAQFAAEEQVFHQSQPWEAAEALEAVARQEETLVAVGQPGQADAGGGAGVDGAVERPAGADRHAEAARRHAPAG